MAKRIIRACDKLELLITKEEEDKEKKLKDVFSALVWYYPIIRPIATDLDNVIDDKLNDMKRSYPKLASELRVKFFLARINFKSKRLI